MSSRITKKKDSASDLPDKKSTMTICMTAIGVLMAILHLGAFQIRQSPSLIIASGLLSSLIFFFSVVMLGSWGDNKVGWGQVSLAIIFALTNAGLVHRICVTTCLLFSAGLLFYLNYASSSIYARLG